MSKLDLYGVEYNPREADMCGEVRAGFPRPTRGSI